MPNYDVYYESGQGQDIEMKLYTVNCSLYMN